jgi:hypothetical protein
VRPLVLVALTAAIAAAPGADTAGAKLASLQGYLSSMSWPIRASLLRAGSITSGIDSSFAAGDPP